MGLRWFGHAAAAAAAAMDALNSCPPGQSCLTCSARASSLMRALSRDAVDRATSASPASLRCTPSCVDRFTLASSSSCMPVSSSNRRRGGLVERGSSAPVTYSQLTDLLQTYADVLRSNLFMGCCMFAVQTIDAFQVIEVNAAEHRVLADFGNLTCHLQ